MQAKKTATKKAPSKPARKATPKNTAQRSVAKKTAPKKRVAGKREGPGAPPKNDPSDVEGIQKKIDAYFRKVKGRPTYTGLLLALGYKSRSSLGEHANGNEPISVPINVALLRVDEAYERRLWEPSCTGAIFALKNRGWTDRPQGGDDSAAMLAAMVAIMTRLRGGAAE